MSDTSAYYCPYLSRANVIYAGAAIVQGSVAPSLVAAVVAGYALRPILDYHELQPGVLIYAAQFFPSGDQRVS